MNTAILFTTMSIQQYVFGSNKLRDNLGASYIVEHIYKYLEEKAGIKSNELDIGYIGGGNALIFTISRDKATDIVKEYTSWLLYTYPEVSVAIAINNNFSKTDSDYKKKLSDLFIELNANKGKHIPITTIPSHGITATCQFSSLSVEVIERNPENSFEQISSLTASKRLNEEDARKEEKLLLNNDILKEYKFPDKLDELGQRKGEDSHIAVVHIDGNGFGQHFMKKESVKETKHLSEKVKTAVKDAFTTILADYTLIDKDIKTLIDPKNYHNNILPIRPIILGGDDVTFVCHGKLGVWFAEKFMEKFNCIFIDEEKKIPFSSCAGVAIVKTKYPFYRAYKLAEELCHSAKSRRKEYMDKNNTEEGGSWIDFHLAYSGLGNTLEEIRALHDNVKGFSRPYRIDQTNDQNSFENIKVLTAKLNSTLPNSKIKDLREMLTKDTPSLAVFIEQLKFQHDEENGFKEQIIQNKSTEEIIKKVPFFDMIELLELYPVNLLNE